MKSEKKKTFDLVRDGSLKMRGTKTHIPNPGSAFAIRGGCTCAVLDNCRGDPEFGEIHGFYITKGCPLHDRKEDNIPWDND